jgi:hypothetical protein
MTHWGAVAPKKENIFHENKVIVNQGRVTSPFPVSNE